MLHGAAAYGSVSYGGRMVSREITETTIVSGTPSVILKAVSQTAVLTTRPETVVLSNNQNPEHTLL